MYRKGVLMKILIVPKYKYYFYIKSVIKIHTRNIVFLFDDPGLLLDFREALVFTII